MGQYHFLVPQADRVSPQAVETAYVCGRDRLPFIGQVSLGQTGELTVFREEDESGTFHILWPVPNRGIVLLSTATLVERLQPYHLPLELARGTLNRLRNLLADWLASNLVVPDAVRTAIGKALQMFIQSLAKQPAADLVAQLAEQSIAASLEGIDAMAAAIVEHIWQARQRHAQKMFPLFVGRLAGGVPEPPVAAAFTAAFNAAAVPFTWGQVEADEGRQDWSACDAQIQWCQANGLRIAGGPLLDLRRSSLPDWIYLWEGDFENLLSVAGDFIRAVVTRYRGKVHFWNAASRLISGDALNLDEEQKVRLAVRAVEVIRSLDPQTPVIVSFDQPWAEYMARRESDLAPLQFADALARADLGISGVGLEINIGSSTLATLPRDQLEFNTMLDHWGSLGLPLLVSVAVPSGGNFTAALQQQWLERFLPLLVVRPIVQAMIWNQLFDQGADDFPHTGLVDSRGQPKPAFQTVAAMRKQYSA
ncbi:MAG TPA: endo-1,4-beta-xylanase [Pirellulales bacterium]|jgi:hypothetical protein